jgi:hypothetical protein
MEYGIDDCLYFIGVIELRFADHQWLVQPISNQAHFIYYILFKFVSNNCEAIALFILQIYIPAF